MVLTAVFRGFVFWRIFFLSLSLHYKAFSGVTNAKLLAALVGFILKYLAL